MKPILFNTEMVRAILDGRKTVTRRVVKPHYRNGEAGFRVVFNTHTGGYVRVEYFDEWENKTRNMVEPYHPRDILYVRETWAPVDGGGYIYRAGFGSDKPLWHPSIHMPREAARIFLRVTDVRVDRLQDITVEDILREGTQDETPPPICLGDVKFPEEFNQWSENRKAEWYNSTARARYIGWCDYADKLIRKFAGIWNACYAKPRPVKGKDGKIDHYESYPWEDIQEVRTYFGKPWYVIGNPWVWVIAFEQINKEEAMRDATD